MNNTIQHLDMASMPLNRRKEIEIKDALIKKYVSVHDNGEPLVSINADHPDIKISPFWEDPIGVIQVEDVEIQYLVDLEQDFMRNYVNEHPDFRIKLRKSAYDRLLHANELFKKQGVQLLIKIGYRPYEVQVILRDEIIKYFQKKFPEDTYEKSYEKACEFIDDPDKKTAPHLTGGAVDATLIDSKTEQPLDMGSPINYPDDISNYTYKNISSLVRIFLHWHEKIEIYFVIRCCRLALPIYIRNGGIFHTVIRTGPISTVEKKVYMA